MGINVFKIYEYMFVIDSTAVQENRHLALCLSSVTYDRLEFSMKLHYSYA
jgi:hypothetical protein